MDATETAGGVFVATILHLAAPASTAVIASLCDQREPVARLAELVTEPARTPATRLPVREDANVFVRLTSHPSTDALPLSPPPPSPLVSRIERLILQPTRRSFIRHDPLLQPDPPMRRTS